MKGGVRAGAIAAILLLLAAGLYLLRPREFLLTYCAIGPLAAALLVLARSRRPGLRNASLLVASASLAIALLDPLTYLANRPPVTAEGSWNSTYHYIWDSEVGTALPANVTAQSRKSIDQGVIYDVTYSFDANGHRQVLGSSDPAADAVVFVGDSFTFGEGVEDSETLPQQFSDQSGRRYKVTNFGVSSFGIQQPVRILELNRIDPFLTSGKRYIVYTAIPDHAVRVVTGLRRGPVYKLQSDGSVAYMGSGQSRTEMFAVAIANRSLFLRDFVIMPLLDQHHAHDTALYVALVRRAADLAQQKYGAKFIVIFWDFPDSPLSAEIKTAFDKAGISYIPVSSILPDYSRDQDKYRLAGDHHPNALADRLLARYLVQHLDDVPPQPTN